MLRLLFVGGILTVGIIASLFSRFAGLLTYVWFALFRPQEFLWSGMGDLRLSLVVGVLFLVPSVVTGVFPNVTHPLSIGTFAFLGLAMVAQSVTFWADASFQWVDAFTRLALVVTLAITILDTRRKVVLFLAVLAVSIGFHTSKAGVVTILGQGVVFADGLGGAFADSNGYALAAAICLPFLWSTSQNLDLTRPIERLASWGFKLAVPLSILMVIATMSRAGFLAVAAGVLIYIALQKSRFIPLISVVVIVTVALPFVPLPAGYFDRIETIRTYEEENETSALSRIHFWRVAMLMAQDHPLGVGLRNYDLAYDTYDFSNAQFGRGRSVHSVHFQVLAELGYAGVVVWFLQFGCAFAVAFRSRRFANTRGLSPGEARFYLTTSNALICSMAMFLIGGSFIALALNDFTWYTFAAVAATDRLARKRKRELEVESEPIELPVEINFPRRATA